MAEFYKEFVVDVMEGGVDNDLYSRAIAAYGVEAVAKFTSLRVMLIKWWELTGSQVLIVGLNGVGAETAKNVILTGVDEVR